MLKKKKKFELPHVYTIAFLLIILFAILTWIVPSGQFERTMMDTAAGEREVAVAGTYQEVPKVDEEGNDMRQGLGAILMAPTRGIQAASDVVAFVLLIGGSFAILTKTNAINAGMSRVIKKLKGKDILLIPVVMLLFSIGGTSFGMSEEALPFYAIFMPIIMSLGYDSMTAFMVCFLGPQMGYIVQRADCTGRCRHSGQPPAVVPLYSVCNLHHHWHRVGYDVCAQGEKEPHGLYYLPGRPCKT